MKWIDMMCQSEEMVEIDWKRIDLKMTRGSEKGEGRGRMEYTRKDLEEGRGQGIRYTERE